MIKRFRSKIGIFLSFGYLTLCLFTVLALFISEPDAMSILALLFLTSPWSFLLLDTVPEQFADGGGPVGFVFILIVSALVNAAILFGLGLLLSVIGRIIGGKNPTR